MYRMTGLAGLPEWLTLELPPVTISLPGGAVIRSLAPTTPVTNPSTDVKWVIPVAFVAGLLLFLNAKRKASK